MPSKTGNRAQRDYSGLVGGGGGGGLKMVLLVAWLVFENRISFHCSLFFFFPLLHECGIVYASAPAHTPDTHMHVQMCGRAYVC